MASLLSPFLKELKPKTEKIRMPAKSAKQFKFMEGIAHGMKSMGKGIGPSPEVAEEFVKKTPKAKRSLFMKSKK